MQPDESYSAGETLIATVAAGDPWLSAPLVTLERQEAGGFEPVIRKNGRALDSDGYHFELLLAADPPYEAQAAPTTRTFEWTIVMPTLRGAPSTDTPLDGTYRLRITGEIDTNSPYELTTDPFSITPI